MQVIETGLLATLFPIYLPTGLWFNSCRVAKRVFTLDLHTDSNKHYMYLSIRLICVNGFWGASTDMGSTTWGYGGPVTAIDCVHPTIASAVTAQWNRFVEAYSSHLKNSTPGNSYRLSWFNEAKRVYEEFIALSFEKQLSNLVITDMYV